MAKSPAVSTQKDAAKQELESALSAFGGRDEVVKRMASLIQKQLMNRTKHVEPLVDFARKGRLPPEVFWQAADRSLFEITKTWGVLPEELWRILQGETSEVSYELFEKLQAPLSLSINEVLGEPVLSDEATIYWEHQRKDASPMLIAAELPAEEGSSPVPQNGGLGLHVYVQLRAIEELACSEGK